MKGLLKKKIYDKGFSLIEILVVIAILGVLVTLVYSAINIARNKAYTARTLQEFRAFEQAMFLYLDDFGSYPPDVSRDIPPGIEVYMGGTDWPKGPYPGSVYDWDNITGADPYIQISLRFCDISGNNCNFPLEDWAADFDHQSSFYWCFEGNCRSHPNQPVSHPGYCANCQN